MALVLADRVQETSTSVGTGTFTLAGAVNGFQSFAVIGNANTTYYVIAGGNEWEVGIGTYTSSGTTLSRDTVLSSSNSNAKVDFSAGVKYVFVSYPEERAVYVNGTALVLPNSATIANNQLTNSTISGKALGTNLDTLTLGSYLTGTSYNGSAAVTAAVDATSANTASKVVARDASGNFSAGTITASLTGTASTATNIAAGAQGSIPYQSAAGTTAFLAKDANATRYLSNTGTTNNPAWAQIDLSNGVTGTLPIGNGGTGATTLAGANIPVTNASNTFTSAQTFRAANAVRSEAASAQDAVVLAGRAGGTASYAVTLTPTTLSASRTLTLPDASGTILQSGTAVTVAQGGTGLTSGTSGGIPFFSSTSAMTSSAALAANALVVGGGAGVAPSTVTTGANVLTALGVAVGSSGAFTTNNAANTFTAAQTFRAANAIRSEAASTQDAVVIAGRAGGTSSYAVTIRPTTLSASRTVTLADGDVTMTAGTMAVVGTAQTFTAAQTFRAANSVRAEAASTQDAIVLAGRAGGTSSYAVTLTPTTLTASRTLTLPNSTGTLLTDATGATKGFSQIMSMVFGL